ncbi:MAG TPA: hypothetical protein VFA14_05425 [Herbaspirillum sp.]|nr:hypothetical protein [Herbaspirillum sp.]
MRQGDACRVIHSTSRQYNILQFLFHGATRLARMSGIALFHAARFITAQPATKGFFQGRSPGPAAGICRFKASVRAKSSAPESELAPNQHQVIDGFLGPTFCHLIKPRITIFGFQVTINGTAQKFSDEFPAIFLISIQILGIFEFNEPNPIIKLHDEVYGFHAMAQAVAGPIIELPAINTYRQSDLQIIFDKHRHSLMPPRLRLSSRS